jgi:hypothetical protein
MKNGGGTEAEQSERQIQVANPPFRVVSMERVSQLPVVEETMKITNNLYGKVRVSNSRVNTDRLLFAKTTLLYETVFCTY